MARGVIGAVLVALSLAVGCSGGDGGPAPCSEDVVVSFSTLSGSASDFVLAGTHVQLLTGGGEGYHDGERWTLLLLQGGSVGLTPPCAAHEVEIVLDQSQVGLEATLYAAPGSASWLRQETSELAGEPIPGEEPYVRWTVTLAEGEKSTYLELAVPGTTCDVISGCLSVLIRSVTFR